MTFTLLAQDPDTGDLGIATTTHAFGVGPVADHSKAGVGVVATQSFVEISYGPLGLELLEQGVPVQEALDRLTATDDAKELRQVAMMDPNGTIAYRTGSRCVPSCGAALGERAIAIGNMLAGDDVIPGALAGYESSRSTFAERLLAGLAAGQAAGGDARGTMSAALQIVTADRPDQLWAPKKLDLRIDYSADPLADLARHLDVKRAYDFFFGAVFAPGLVTGAEPVVGLDLKQALEALDVAQEALPGDLEATLWQGVLMLRAGQYYQGCRQVAAVLAARPEFAPFVDGLHKIGVIATDSAEIQREST